MLHKTLLACGIASALVYAALDLIGGLGIEGYSFLHQAISEQSAVGVPRPFVLQVLSPVYMLLLTAFGIGVYLSAGSNRALRMAGILIIASGVSGIGWPLFPMSPRGAAEGQNDTGHIIMTIITLVLTMGFLGFGAAAFGRRFRAYSIATIIAVLLFGLLTAPLAARLAANQPTPWMGLYERVCIYAYQLWLTVLAARLLGSGAARVPVTMPGTPRTGRDAGSSRPVSPHPG
ncbi:MAG TPA: DUF998 domain-containing protein [Longimicrobiales bacterium]